MEHKQRLPIWRDANRLLLEIEQAVRGFPRYHKYAVGTDMRRQAMIICRLLVRAQSWFPCAAWEPIRACVAGIQRNTEKRSNIIGRSRYTITDTSAPHFLTFTVLNWLPVFTRPGTVRIILDALDWRQQNKGVKVYGYVILENHMHCILEADDLSRQLHDFKAFTATAILHSLQESKAERILELLAFFKKSHKRDALYQFWEEGSHPQLLQNERGAAAKTGLYSSQSGQAGVCGRSGSLAIFQRPEL